MHVAVDDHRAFIPLSYFKKYLHSMSAPYKYFKVNLPKREL